VQGVGPKSVTDKHPCFHHNRHPFPDTVTVQDGWEEITVMIAGDFTRRVRVPRMVTRPNPMSKECQQWGEYGWARIQGWDCSGCRWMPNENNAEVNA